MAGFLALAASISPAWAEEAGPRDPWAALTATRESLVESGGQVADFVQVYVPAGFSSGERESGRLFLALPDCLRWDYELPFPRTFLICGTEVFTWNPGEESGRRAQFDPAEEPGLDLMMLGVERLSERYEASAVDSGGGRIEVHLVPIVDQGAFAEADLTLDLNLMRPLRLSYRDAEGNETAFELSGYRPLGDATDPFEAPTDLEWID